MKNVTIKLSKAELLLLILVRCTLNVTQVISILSILFHSIIIKFHILRLYFFFLFCKQGVFWCSCSIYGKAHKYFTSYNMYYMRLESHLFSSILGSHHQFNIFHQQISFFLLLYVFVKMENIIRKNLKEKLCMLT